MEKINTEKRVDQAEKTWYGKSAAFAIAEELLISTVKDKKQLS